MADELTGTVSQLSAVKPTLPMGVVTSYSIVVRRKGSQIRSSSAFGIRVIILCPVEKIALEKPVTAVPKESRKVESRPQIIFPTGVTTPHCTNQTGYCNPRRSSSSHLRNIHRQAD
ncbi:hypothetical protein ElyMa_005119400 [Elysia marginata]|uniref:Uncharacterized protein n=1 Tax=Elysia marginata TaxID=1093978 RepID=A0AAV4JLQ7_9GAST|nr:hypothetical protein ElyMa_005119400 [Elysia marginata]